MSRRAFANMHSLYKKIPRSLISFMLFAVIILFLVLYLQGTDFSKLKHLSVNWLLVVYASFIALFFRFWMVIIWRTILRALGTNELPSFYIMSAIYAKSWLARYIPGTVTWIASKVIMASKYGISKSRLSVSSLLEGGMQVAASVIVSFVLIGLDPHIHVLPLSIRVIIIIVSILCLLTLYPPVFNKVLLLAYTKLKKKIPSNELKINNQAVIRSFILFAIGTIINGTASFFLVRALDPSIGFTSYIYVVGVFGLAGAIGIATPFLPSGIGVRDGVLLILLAAIMPREIALVITIASRVWHVIIDIIFYAVSESMPRLLKQPLKQ